MRKVITLGLALSLTFSVCAAAQPKAYQKALGQYWKQFFSGEGVSPLFYASSIHSPKTVWEKGPSGMDFFSSGEELLPDGFVKIMKRQISLGTTGLEKSVSASLVLQLAGVSNIEDAKLDIATSNDLEWNIQFIEPELHFIPKLDANRCLRKVTSRVRDEFFQERSTSESRLYVVTKAVFVNGFEISVQKKAGGKLEVNAEVASLLTKLGFKLEANSTRATLVTGKNMYVAAGLRELKQGGVLVSAGNKTDDAFIDVPETEDLTIPVPEFVGIIVDL